MRAGASSGTTSRSNVRRNIDRENDRPAPAPVRKSAGVPVAVLAWCPIQWPDQRSEAVLGASVASASMRHSFALEMFHTVSEL